MSEDKTNKVLVRTTVIVDQETDEAIAAAVRARRYTNKTSKKALITEALRAVFLSDAPDQPASQKIDEKVTPATLAHDPSVVDNVSENSLGASEFKDIGAEPHGETELLESISLLQEIQRDLARFAHLYGRLQLRAQQPGHTTQRSRRGGENHPQNEPQHQPPGKPVPLPARGTPAKKPAKGRK